MRREPATREWARHRRRRKKCDIFNIISILWSFSPTKFPLNSLECLKTEYHFHAKTFPPSFVLSSSFSCFFFRRLLSLLCCRLQVRNVCAISPHCCHRFRWWLAVRAQWFPLVSYSRSSATGLCVCVCAWVWACFDKRSFGKFYRIPPLACHSRKITMNAKCSQRITKR